jgi:hypothetical protein
MAKERWTSQGANVDGHIQNFRHLRRRRYLFRWIDLRGNPDDERVVDQSRVLLAELEGTFRIDMATGDESYRYYPRVTRAYEDAGRSVRARLVTPAQFRA